MADNESKVNIIKVASVNSLAFFTVIVLSLGVLLASLTAFNDDKYKIIVYVCVIIIVIVMIIFAGLNLLKDNSGIEFPGHGSLLGNVAVKGFYEGGDAAILSGRWLVHWEEYDESGIPHPYKILDEETGLEVNYPDTNISVKVHASMISAEAQDTTTKRVYFMEGRISTHNTVSLIYWSQKDTPEARLVGGLLLKLTRQFEQTTMKGKWAGFSRDDKYISGIVTWTKLTK